MQTFLPWGPDFKRNAETLDKKRLGKQRVENLQIIKCLNGNSKGWSNHPAVKMWKGYEPALYLYHHAICTQWKSYGYKDTCLEKFELEMTDEQMAHFSSGKAIDMPPWIYDQAFADSHKSNLIRKDPSFYMVFFDGIISDDTMPYIWPEQKEDLINA